jgi:hypothetical protein
MRIIIYYKVKYEVMPSSFEAQAHINLILSTTPSHKGIPPWWFPSAIWEICVTAG